MEKQTNKQNLTMAVKKIVNVNHYQDQPDKHERWRWGSGNDWEGTWRLNTVRRVITDRLHLRKISTGDGNGTGDWQGTEGNRKWQENTKRTRKPEYKTKPEKYKTRIVRDETCWKSWRQLLCVHLIEWSYVFLGTGCISCFVNTVIIAVRWILFW